MKPFFRKPTRRARTESRPTACRLAITTTLRTKKGTTIRRKDTPQPADQAETDQV
jgi:hypothetical protein